MYQCFSSAVFQIIWKSDNLKFRTVYIGAGKEIISEAMSLWAVCLLDAILKFRQSFLSMNGSYMIEDVSIMRKGKRTTVSYF